MSLRRPERLEPKTRGNGLLQIFPTGLDPPHSFQKTKSLSAPLNTWTDRRRLPYYIKGCWIGRREHLSSVPQGKLLFPLWETLIYGNREVKCMEVVCVGRFLPIPFVPAWFVAQACPTHPTWYFFNKEVSLLYQRGLVQRRKHCALWLSRFLKVVLSSFGTKPMVLRDYYYWFGA